MYDTIPQEYAASVIYADGSPENLSTFRRLFEENQDSDIVFKVQYANGIDNIGPHLANAERAVIILGGTLTERDKLRACYAYGAESENPAPIVVLGPDHGARELIDYFDLGIADYLVEPVAPSELLAKVHHILMKPSINPASELFENRYERQGFLGEGGFGSVYLALDHSSQWPKKVALKLFRIEEEDTTFRSRYLQEAFQLSRINHPNIVKLLDFGKTETDYYLVTEFVDGTTLEDVHNEHGVLSEFQAALVGYYVGMALNHMGRASIVHRDLSPRNIMLTHDGDVKVIDFGLAKTHLAATLNTEDQFQGTPYFIAPEYILGNEVGTPADLYSLAITIYYMLTGNFPFDGDDAHEVLEAHLKTIADPLTSYIPDLDEDFSTMIAWALSREPEDRPPLPDFIRVMKAVIDTYSQAGEESDEEGDEGVYADEEYEGE